MTKRGKNIVRVFDFDELCIEHEICAEKVENYTVKYSEITDDIYEKRIDTKIKYFISDIGNQSGKGCGVIEKWNKCDCGVFFVFFVGFSYEYADPKGTIQFSYDEIPDHIRSDYLSTDHYSSDPLYFCFCPPLAFDYEWSLTPSFSDKEIRKLSITKNDKNAVVAQIVKDIRTHEKQIKEGISESHFKKSLYDLDTLWVDDIPMPNEDKITLISKISKWIRPGYLSKQVVADSLDISRLELRKALNGDCRHVSTEQLLDYMHSEGDFKIEILVWKNKKFCNPYERDALEYLEEINLLDILESLGFELTISVDGLEPPIQYYYFVEHLENSGFKIRLSFQDKKTYCTERRIKLFKSLEELGIKTLVSVDERWENERNSTKLLEHLESSGFEFAGSTSKNKQDSKIHLLRVLNNFFIEPSIYSSIHSRRDEYHDSIVKLLDCLDRCEFTISVEEGRYRSDKYPNKKIELLKYLAEKYGIAPKFSIDEDTITITLF